MQPIEHYDPSQSFGKNRVEKVRREAGGGETAGYFLTVPSRQGPEMHKVENLLCNIFDGGTTKVYFRFRTPVKGAGPCIHGAMTRCCAPNWNAFWVKII